MPQITITDPGYVYIYVANESEDTRVWWDDLKITHQRSNIVAGADYYPFGLPMENREITREDYRYGYQGQYAERDKETGWNAFELRMYDPARGRWLSPDPYGQYASPYMGMGNMPHMGTDPDGGLFGVSWSQFKAFLFGGNWTNFAKGVNQAWSPGIFRNLGKISIGSVGAGFLNGVGQHYLRDKLFYKVEAFDPGEMAFAIKDMPQPFMPNSGNFDNPNISKYFEERLTFNDNDYDLEMKTDRLIKGRVDIGLESTKHGVKGYVHKTKFSIDVYVTSRGLSFKVKVSNSSGSKFLPSKDGVVQVGGKAVRITASLNPSFSDQSSSIIGALPSSKRSITHMVNTPRNLGPTNLGKKSVFGD